ncbi:MAG: diacylglycerol kinase family lipid kinase [Chloroflexi bacterium]|nr:diacylglycerol kinase family lipid kinase [Chloroflexota bacterium]
MKYLIIVNPTSGRGHARKVIPQIETLLRSHNLDYELVLTERPWHAAELTEQAARERIDVVVTASGDGTANESLNGLMKARQAGFNHTAMGLLPVGTGNDFAYGMGVRGSLEENIALLAKNTRRWMDIGKVTGGDYPEGRYFGNGVGVGFDAYVGFVAADIRWMRGLLAYLIAALETIFIYFKAPTVRIEYEDRKLEQDALMVSIMNGQRMGGGFFMAPDGLPYDNMFDLCIAGAPGKFRILQLLPTFMQGTQATQPEITTGRARKVIVTALKGTLPAHCDGETLCKEGQSLTIELVPHALEFITAL